MLSSNYDYLVYIVFSCKALSLETYCNDIGSRKIIFCSYLLPCSLQKHHNTACKQTLLNLRTAQYPGPSEVHRMSLTFLELITIGTNAPYFLHNFSTILLYASLWWWVCVTKASLVCEGIVITSPGHHVLWKLWSDVMARLIGCLTHFSNCLSLWKPFLSSVRLLRLSCPICFSPLKPRMLAFLHFQVF